MVRTAGVEPGTAVRAAVGAEIHLARHRFAADATAGGRLPPPRRRPRFGIVIGQLPVALIAGVVPPTAAESEADHVAFVPVVGTAGLVVRTDAVDAVFGHGRRYVPPGFRPVAAVRSNSHTTTCGDVTRESPEADVANDTSKPE